MIIIFFIVSQQVFFSLGGGMSFGMSEIKSSSSEFSFKLGMFERKSFEMGLQFSINPSYKFLSTKAFGGIRYDEDTLFFAVNFGLGVGVMIEDIPKASAVVNPSLSFGTKIFERFYARLEPSFTTFFGPKFGSFLSILVLFDVLALEQ